MSHQTRDGSGLAVAAARARARARLAGVNRRVLQALAAVNCCGS